MGIFDLSESSIPRRLDDIIQARDSSPRFTPSTSILLVEYISMAFGGLFGGSSSSSPFGSPLPTAASPSGSATLQSIQTAITQQSAVANARYLIAKVNENCFDHCIPNPPGSSLSSSEHKCLTACMEKYFDGWNVVHRSYVTRMQKEGASMVGNATAGPAGKELF